MGHGHHKQIFINFGNHVNRTFVTRTRILFKVTAIIILKLFFDPSVALSQYGGKIAFEYFTADQGLSDNRIYAIYRDSKDYLWVGTTINGLNKYDGKNITIYKNLDDQPRSISNNGIRYIFEDSKNNLWIGTTDGLNLYDPKSSSFVVFRHDSTDNSGYYNNFITAIIEDKKGNLWITYDQGVGLAKLDGEKNRFTRYRIKDPGNDYEVNSMTSIKKDSKGQSWIATRGPGIYQFNQETGDFIAYSDPAIDFGKGLEKKMCIDQNDMVWIGSYGNGLYSFDPSSGKFKRFGTNAGNKGTNNRLVCDILQPDDDHLLIGTDQGGINLYNMVSNTFEYIVKDENTVYGLNNNGILCLHHDKEGILWVGTTRGGVNYFNPKEHKFNLFDHSYGTNSLSYNIVGCFYEDSKGLIWIGTDGGGINVYDPGTGDFTFYKHDPLDPYSVSGDVIRCFAEDKEGDMWIGTWNAGLNRFDRKQGRFYHYFHDKQDTSSIAANSTWHMKIDHNNNIWLCSYLQGIDIFNKKEGVVKRFSANEDDPRALRNDHVWLVYEDPQKNIWICTRDGLNRYDSITNSFTVYKDFPDNNIAAFCMGPDGKLWAGSTGKGLFLFEQDGTIVKIYNDKNGLPDNMVHAIVDDDQGNLWISTNKGISHFNQKTGKFRNYYKNDGLQGNIFFQQSFLKTKSGEIYFGGYNGFNSFHPDSLTDNNYIPKVYITGFNLFNKPAPVGALGSPLQNHISETKEIMLSWRESVFSFEFTAINYTHPEQNQYAYKMEGFEKEWNYVKNIRNATYTSMDAGEYIFRVKASNNDGIWNEEGTSVKIVIAPPFWETWWFRSIVSLLLATAFFSAYRVRVSSLKKQKINLEKEVGLRTTELNETNTLLEERQQRIEEQSEELKVQTETLFVANEHLKKSNATKDKLFSIIAHDLKNPFNSILGFSELMIKKWDKIEDTKKKQNMEFISDSAKNIYRLLENLLQWSRSQMDNIKFNPENISLHGLAKENINLFSDLIKQKNISVKLNIPDDLYCHTDSQLTRIVIRNLLNNAIKFTENGTITFGSEIKENMVHISISDTGVGIAEDKLKILFEVEKSKSTEGTRGEQGTGLGLIICEEFVVKNGGTIQVESELNKGTTFVIALPLQEPVVHSPG